jgi:hypothetical protein
MTPASLSTRTKVVNEARRRGKRAGLAAKGYGKPLTTAAARLLARDSAGGHGGCAVPERWQLLFKRVFVQAALYVANEGRKEGGGLLHATLEALATRS